MYEIYLSYDNGLNFYPVGYSFEIQERPVITDISPKVLGQNRETAVTIYGSNFNPNMQRVYFGGFKTSYVFKNEGEILVSAPVTSQATEFALDVSIESVVDGQMSNSV